MTYSVTTNEALRALCIKNNWFTCGTNKQYEKLFYANQHGCPIEEITTIIWLCSDEGYFRRDILDELKQARVEYWKPFFNITHIDRLFKVWNQFGITMECNIYELCDYLTDPLKPEWHYENLIKVAVRRSQFTAKIIWERDGGEEE